MFVRLTSNQRKKAGWLVALVYLLCIVVPAISHALPGEHALVTCPIMASDVSGSPHVHEEVPGPMHTHLGGQKHDHSSAGAMAMSHDENRSSMSGATAEDVAPSKKDTHSTGRQCCATMCVSAIPAALFDFAMPPMPTLVRIATSYRATADNAPAVRYRPPIA